MGQLRPTGLLLLQQSLLVTVGPGRCTGRAGHPFTTTQSLPALIEPKTKQRPPHQLYSLQLGLTPPVHQSPAVGKSRQLERGSEYTAPGVISAAGCGISEDMIFALLAIHLCSRAAFRFTIVMYGASSDQPICGEISSSPRFGVVSILDLNLSRFPAALPH